ncbi:hypothetical protein CDAR_487541 [Caerostris darwini]|uniref:Uncharacterized protein n=1 Tax=Caerostris darwini TaxID=1538125 RepID=A0AAV4PTG4_9ARAC|nr:hypothetical protein CDAR_487541 [Caerostris darwini]
MTAKRQLRDSHQIRYRYESDLQHFLGNESHSDYFKLLEQDGDSLLVGARNIVYNISLSTLQEQKGKTFWSDPRMRVRHAIGLNGGSRERHLMPLWCVVKEEVK